MNISPRAPLYDLFKLIVAIVLLLIFLWLWMRPNGARQPEPILPTVTSPPSLPTPVPTSTPPLPTDTVTPATTVSPSPTSTPAAIETPSATLVPTNPASPTETPVSEPLPTPIVEIAEGPELCEAVSHSQIQVGMQAVILRSLNLRSSAGISDNWILTSAPGTQVEIIGGPECKRYQYGGAYLWWQIKLPDGMVGWSAEASAYGAFYFMGPVK